nr:hypothetical protein CFP56_37284 [Quercus suber]
MTELESLRRRIQRHMIDHDGIQSVDLWYAALRVVASSRYLGWFMAQDQKPAAVLTPFSRQIVPAFSKASPRRDVDTTTSAPNGNGNGNGSYVRKLVVSTDRMVGEPEVALTEVTNTPTTPKMVFKPHRKGAFSEGTDANLSASTKELKEPIMRDDNPKRFMEYQKERVATVAAASAALQSDLRLSCSMPNGHHLSQDVIDLILAFSVSPQQLSALSPKQKIAAWQWGQNRKTLLSEMEWRKHDRSSQVWMLLEKIGCLAYDEA